MRNHHLISVSIRSYPPHGRPKLVELYAIKTHIELIPIVVNFFVDEYWSIFDSIQPELLSFTLDFKGFIEMHRLSILLIAMKGLYFEYHGTAQQGGEFQLEGVSPVIGALIGTREVCI